MVELQPCSACGRHVKVDEATCPFCAAAFQPGPSRPMPRGRLSRAAVFASATLATAAAGCGGKTPATQQVVDNQGPDGGVDETEPPHDADYHPVDMPYGAPPLPHRLV